MANTRQQDVRSIDIKVVMFIENLRLEKKLLKFTFRLLSICVLANFFLPHSISLFSLYEVFCGVLITFHFYVRSRKTMRTS